MKKTALAMATVVALMSVAPAYATASVPEPSGWAQLALGLIALGGLALVVRKRAPKNDAQ